MNLDQLSEKEIGELLEKANERLYQLNQREREMEIAITDLFQTSEYFKRCRHLHARNRPFVYISNFDERDKIQEEISRYLSALRKKFEERIKNLYDVKEVKIEGDHVDVKI